MYTTLNQALSRVNFNDYSEYLSSNLWKNIRNKVLNRSKGRCELCTRKAKLEVYHRGYTLFALLGKRLDSLIACCDLCHREKSFENDSYAICWKCRKNPNSNSHVLCGLCRRELHSSDIHTIGG